MTFVPDIIILLNLKMIVKNPVIAQAKSSKRYGFGGFWINMRQKLAKNRK